MQIHLNNFKTHHQSRFCFNCFKRFQLPLLTSILFKDIEICPECTQRIESEKHQKIINPNDLRIFKQKYQDRLQIFLPHHFRETTQFCVAGYEGSLGINEIRNFLLRCRSIKLHNVVDLVNNISFLQKSDLPKFNISFSNIVRLQLKGQNIESIQFLQYFSFQNLQDLSLWDNNIVQLKSLNKCKFKKLSEIHFSHNRLKNVSSLSRSDFKALQKISLGFRQSPSFQQYKSLLKLSSVDMKTIYLNYLQFIQFYDKSIRSRYSSVYIISLNNCSYSNDRRNL